MKLSKLLLILKGGAGSGNFGHKGRPGKHGGSSSSKNNEKIFLEFPLLRPLGNNLHVTDFDNPDVKFHLKDLSLIPSHLLTALKDKGVSFYVGTGGITGLDHNNDIKGMRGRGWPPDITVDMIPGCYDSSTKTVTIGTSIYSSGFSVALHETGHAIQDVVVGGHTPKLAEIHSRNYRKFPEYLRQEGKGGVAGVQEMFAEGFARTLVDRRGALRQYGKDFVEYIEGL